MALCIEGSLFSFCFPIKNKSVLKSCWLLIPGAEGPELGGPNLRWPRDVQGAEADSQALSPQDLLMVFPPHCLVSPAPLGFVVSQHNRSELFSSQHPTQAPSEHHISVAPS